MLIVLTTRQQAELDYHRQRALELADLVDRPVEMDVVESTRRRWWNAYWSFYTHLLALSPAGKRILVVGCGFGEDAVRIASVGASVCACDLSPESVAIARRRANREHPLLASTIEFAVMPAEKLEYPDRWFDTVAVVDILHHVDIPAAMAEIRRVIKPDGLVIGDELYTHSLLQRVRKTRFVDRWLAPPVQRVIYVGKPYITEDERKLDEQDLEQITAAFVDVKVSYFDALNNRLVPDRWPQFPFFAQLDRLALIAAGRWARFLANRLVFVGRVGE